MGYKLLVTDAAYSDLDNALSYISDNLANPLAAVRLLNKIETVYKQISLFPLMFESCRDKHLCAMGYRKAVIDKFVMIYQLDEQEKVIYILRFFMAAGITKSLFSLKAAVLLRLFYKKLPLQKMQILIEKCRILLYYKSDKLYR